MILWAVFIYSWFLFILFLLALWIVFFLITKEICTRHRCLSDVSSDSVTINLDCFFCWVGEKKMLVAWEVGCYLNKTRIWYCHNSHACYLTCPLGEIDYLFFRPGLVLTHGDRWSCCLLKSGLKYPMLISVIRSQYRGLSSSHVFLWHVKCSSQFKHRDNEAMKNNNWMPRVRPRSTLLIFFCGWIVTEHLPAFGWGSWTTCNGYTFYKWN